MAFLPWEGTFRPGRVARGGFLRLQKSLWHWLTTGPVFSRKLIFKHPRAAPVCSVPLGQQLPPRVLVLVLYACHCPSPPSGRHPHQPTPQVR